MIEIANLFKYYGKRRAVGPLSCRIEAGEVVGLLGLNGAGKTTTLRILACDLLPSTGSVTIGGVDVTGNPERVRAMIGYLSDTPPLYDEMRVREYLRFAARLRRVSKQDMDQYVDDAQAATGLDDVARDPIASLSHGYRKRVGIAQAIVHKPKLVVLDEPSSGLDPVQIREMRALVRGLGGDHTVVVSSHNLPEISQMCERLLVIRDGEIAASGSETELVRDLMSGDTLETTLRLGASENADQLAASLAQLPGVEDVEQVMSREGGDGVVSFQIATQCDCRALVSAAVVGRGHELLALGRSQRELESVFAKLASSTEAAA